MTTPPPYPSSTDALDPDRCALVVVDMQNDYCHVEGALARLGADVSPAADTAAGIRRLAAGAAEAGVPRIYLRTEHSHWFDTEAWLARGYCASRRACGSASRPSASHHRSRCSNTPN
jgi:nicotinamidase-related amidase